MNLTTATPIEIDTVLSNLYIAEAALVQKEAFAISRVMDKADLRFAADKPRQREHRAIGTLDQAVAILAKQVEAKVFRYTSIQSTLDDLAKVQDALAANRDEQAPLHAEYDARGGWTRAFLVLNNNGHVHSSRSCSTTYPTTHWGWLPQVSGLSEAEIVAQAGADACTICYPSAPVETAGPRQVLHVSEEAAAAARETKAQEKQARLQAKIDKGLTSDGEPLYVVTERGIIPSHMRRAGEPYERTERFATERAAMQWVVQTLAWSQGYYKSTLTDSQQEAIGIVSDAVAAKHGKSRAEVDAEIAAKVVAKIKRDS